MMWWGNGAWGHSWWWPGIMIMAVVMIICMVMMARMMSHGATAVRAGNAEHRRQGEPERILANRLASGEIDIAEYQRLLDTLQRTAHSTGT